MRVIPRPLWPMTLVFVIGALSFADLAMAAPPLKSAITVKGKVLPSGAYHLLVRYDPGSSAEDGFDGLLIAALPSGSALLSYCEPGSASGLAIQELAPAKARLEGRLLAFQHEVVLDVAPISQGDQRITVMLFQDGQEYLVADGQVPLHEFAFTTSFSPESLYLGPVSEFLAGNDCSGSKRRHCCSGFRCPTNCVCCSGASFCCSLIECTIECGDCT